MLRRRSLSVAAVAVLVLGHGAIVDAAAEGEKAKEQTPVEKVADILRERLPEDVLEDIFGKRGPKEVESEEGASPTVVKGKESSRKITNFPDRAATHEPDMENFGEYVESLKAQGLRGQALAEAIHVELV